MRMPLIRHLRLPFDSQAVIHYRMSIGYIPIHQLHGVNHFAMNLLITDLPYKIFSIGNFGFQPSGCRCTIQRGLQHAEPGKVEPGQRPAVLSGGIVPGGGNVAG